MLYFNKARGWGSAGRVRAETWGTRKKLAKGPKPLREEGASNTAGLRGKTLFLGINKKGTGSRV